MTELSILARQRAYDATLAEFLRTAADRLEQLNAALAEARHERDGYRARLERMGEKA